MSGIEQHPGHRGGCPWHTAPDRSSYRVRLRSREAAGRAVANALHALTLLIARQLMNELQGLDQSIDYFVVRPLCPLTGSPYDFSQTSELIERAARSTDAWRSGGGLDHPGVHAQLSTHKHMH
jgi:hypothetical protein